jgi:hypothetical protein
MPCAFSKPKFYLAVSSSDLRYENRIENSLVNKILFLDINFSILQSKNSLEVTNSIQIHIWYLTYIVVSRTAYKKGLILDTI